MTWYQSGLNDAVPDNHAMCQMNCNTSLLVSQANCPMQVNSTCYVSRLQCLWIAYMNRNRGLDGSKLLCLGHGSYQPGDIHKLLCPATPTQSTTTPTIPIAMVSTSLGVAQLAHHSTAAGHSSNADGDQVGLLHTGARCRSDSTASSSNKHGG